jgi:hypothetical protein
MDEVAERDGDADDNAGDEPDESIDSHGIESSRVFVAVEKPG